MSSMNAESFSYPSTSRTGSSQPDRLETTSHALIRQTHSGLPLSATSQSLLTHAEAILGQEDISSNERHMRLEIVRAVMTGTVIRPSDDSPEMRNPAYWVLENDCFVVAPGIQPVEAIEDLWVLHGADGLPVPRIRCLKYTTLILIQGIIQYFRTTGNADGIDAMNNFLGRKVIPDELPNKGYDILWKRHYETDRLLPGDQVWFDNPFFERGRELFREQFQQEALHAGKDPDSAANWAKLRAKAVTAGEEGSNAFYVGDDHFILGADSLVTAFRGPLLSEEAQSLPAHEQVFTQKLFNLECFREHMMEDNFSVQAVIRADSHSVKPECFTIERVRTPLDPKHFIQYHTNHLPSKEISGLISNMASSNPAPVMHNESETPFATFAEDYDWQEQDRVRLAIDAAMRADPDTIWWPLHDNRDDDGYVLTARRGTEVRNFTLGMLCGDLAYARLCLCFTRRLPLVPGRLPDTFHPEHEFLRNEKQWRADAIPLFAMQSMLCKTAIKEWDHVKETEPGEDGRSHRFSQEEKMNYIKALQEEIEERTRTRRAACEEVILPCRPAPVGWEGFHESSVTKGAGSPK